MANNVVDSLDAIEMLMSLEEQLADFGNRFPRVEQYLVDPFESQSTSGDRVWVIARFGVSVIFACFDRAQFGTGALLRNGTVEASRHFETLEAAVRAFAEQRGHHDA